METLTASNYCRVCGNSVTGKICENCGCNPYAGNAYCNNCGADSLPQALMCPKCKNYFPSPTATPFVYTDNYEDIGVNRKSNTGKWLIGLVIVAAIIGFVIYSMNRGNENGYHDVVLDSITIPKPTLPINQTSKSASTATTDNKTSSNPESDKDIRSFSENQIMHILSLKTYESADGKVAFKFHENGTFEYYSGTRLEEDAGGFIKGDYGQWKNGRYMIGDVFKRDFTTTSTYYYSRLIRVISDNGDKIQLELHQKFLSDGSSFSYWELVNDMDTENYFPTFVINVFPDQEKYLH